MVRLYLLYSRPGKLCLFQLDTCSYIKSRYVALVLVLNNDLTNSEKVVTNLEGNVGEWESNVIS